MLTFYVLRSKKDGGLYRQEFRGTYRECAPVDPNKLSHLQDVLLFVSRKKAEQFIADPSPLRLPNPDDVEVASMEINFYALPADPDCEVHVYLMGDGNCTCRKPRKKQTKKAFRNHYVTDMGNGGALCSNCGHSLNAQYDGLGLKELVPPPNPCPGCGLEWEEGDISISGGGSDF